MGEQQKQGERKSLGKRKAQGEPVGLDAYKTDYGSIEEVPGGHLMSTWLRIAAQFGPACFVAVTGMLLLAIMALKDVLLTIAYAGVAAICLCGLVAIIFKRG